MFNKQKDDLKLIQGLKKQDENALNICINRYQSYVSYIVANIIGESLPNEDKEEIIVVNTHTDPLTNITSGELYESLLI